MPDRPSHDLLRRVVEVGVGERELPGAMNAKTEETHAA
jgi:hypothetical protein